MNASERWDQRLHEHGGHLLQSWQWGEFKRSHLWLPERIEVEDASGVAMAQVLFRHKGPLSIGYVPRGPVLDGDASALWPLLRKKIDAAAGRHRAVSIIFEPDTPLGLTGSYRDAGVVMGPATVQPARTVKVPLLDDDALLAQMHKKTRYNIRLASRRGATFAAMEPDRANVAAVYALMQDTAHRNAFGIHSIDYYHDVLLAMGDNGLLLGGWAPDGELATGLIAARFGNETIYLYGASSTAHRSHGAGLALQFEAMKWAREQGSTVYDLWGIPPVDPDSITDSEVKHHIAGSRGDDWRGLYRFKTGFGGEIVDYPPSMERRYIPVVPWLARRLGIVPS